MPSSTSLFLRQFQYVSFISGAPGVTRTLRHENGFLWFGHQGSLPLGIGKILRRNCISNLMLIPNIVQYPSLLYLMPVFLRTKYTYHISVLKLHIWAWTVMISLVDLYYSQNKIALDPKQIISDDKNKLSITNQTITQEAASWDVERSSHVTFDLTDRMSCWMSENPFSCDS